MPPGRRFEPDDEWMHYPRKGSPTAVFPISAVLLKAKREKGRTFAHPGASLGRHPVWIAAPLYDRAQASPEEALRLQVLGLEPEAAEMPQEYPAKGSLTETVPIDPFPYRFFEIMQLYGMPIKAVTQ